MKTDMRDLYDILFSSSTPIKEVSVTVPPPEVRVVKLTCGGVFMAKYSEVFKIKLVTEYLYGNLGYTSLTKKYNMPSTSPLENWVRSYKPRGMEGLNIDV